LEALEDRLCPSGGLLDTSFNGTGTETVAGSLSNSASATVVYPNTGSANDGKIVQVNSVNVNGTNEARILRLNRSGALDTTFNGTGSVYIQVSGKSKQNAPSTYADAVALQPDGKILVGGYVNLGSSNLLGVWNSEYLVARLNTDGSLDNTFGNKGLYVYNPTSYTEEVTSLAVLPDGSILAAGAGWTTSQAYAVLKLTSSGALNSSFGSNGVALVNIPGSYANQDAAAAIAVVPSTGQIVLAGNPDLVVLTQSGKLDTSFNATGYVSAGAALNGAAVQGNSTQGYEIVVSGGHGSSQFVGRYSLSGAVDTSFGGAGTGFYTFGGGFTTNTLALAADGSIIVGGTQSYTAGDGSQHTEMAVGHLSANGILDTSFGPNGNGFGCAMIGLDSAVYGLAIDPNNGEIVACGSSSGAGALAVFTAP
jgi:uncharacterized delta-60 repeat protein